MHIKLTAAQRTDVGKQREQNEDSVYTRIETLADGDRGLSPRCARRAPPAVCDRTRRKPGQNGLSAR